MPWMLHFDMTLDEGMYKCVLLMCCIALQIPLHVVL